MATFLEVIPVEHETKRTYILRIDDDFRISIREDNTNIQRNYTGLDVDNGQQLDGGDVADPITYVRGAKDSDGNSRLFIGVKCYHPLNDPSAVPSAGFYYYDTKTYYDYDPILQEAKGESTDGKQKFPTNPAGRSQSYPITIFTTSGHSLPTGNTVNPSFTARRLYAELRTVDARQRFLKGIIQETLDHEDMPIWLVRSDYDGRNTARDSIGEIANLIARPESFVIWLEMMANAVHNTTNFNSEEKFNLLHGELTLNKDDLTTKPVATYGTAQIRQNHTDVSSWSFHRFGNVGAAPTYKYGAPTANQWPAESDSRIVLTGSTLGNTWRQWIRNQV